MEYFYYFETASLTLRVFDYLCSQPQLPIDCVAAIHQMDGWLVKITMNSPLNFQQDSNLRAYLIELGIPQEPSKRISRALASLEEGLSPFEIMRRYQVVVVFYGSLQQEEIQALRQLLI